MLVLPLVELSFLWLLLTPYSGVNILGHSLNLDYKTWVYYACHAMESFQRSYISKKFFYSNINFII